MDDSLKHNSERTSLLGDPKKARKSNDSPEEINEFDSIENDGKLTKMQIYFKREEIADRSLISAVKTLAQLSREKSV